MHTTPQPDSLYMSYPFGYYDDTANSIGNAREDLEQFIGEAGNGCYVGQVLDGANAGKYIGFSQDYAATCGVSILFHSQPVREPNRHIALYLGILDKATGRIL